MFRSRLSKIFICFFLFAQLQPSCRKPFEPAAIKSGNHYLVVDGVINMGINSVTSININRTRNVLDTLTSGIPELHAQVSIVSGNGSSYLLQDTANTGVYTSTPLTLDISQKYGIAITTSDGKTYASDLVVPKYTPSLDSIYWRQPNDLTIYADTHDPSGNTRYYRWEFIETWAHDAQLQTTWRLSNGLIIPTDSTTQTSFCWTTMHSTDILLASTNGLSEDIIHAFPVTTIPNGDSKIDKRYSILVREYALNEDAYNYWQIIQKTSQKLGSFFDLQPSQLNGNIHATNSSDAVIGFMSASSIQQERSLIYYTNLNNWIHNPLTYSCDTLTVPVNPVDYRIYTEDHPGFSPYYFSTNGPLVLASSICLDCTLLGGTNIKPSFW